MPASRCPPPSTWRPATTSTGSSGSRSSPSSTGSSRARSSRRASARSGRPDVPLLTADRVRAALLSPGDRFRMSADVPATFKAGDRVRARNIHPVGHTRLPRYARGRVGVIEGDHGVFVFADASGNGLGKIAQHLYTVRFTARELWGEAASPRDAVYLDLWDAHLDP